MKNSKDNLGTRIKNYESVTDIKLINRSYSIIRLDGRGFSSYTKRLNKPFDFHLSEDMIQTTQYLCENIQGCQLGYTQSDEITLILTDFETYETQSWFDNRLQKMCSISSSIATSKFNQLRLSTYYYQGKAVHDLLNLKLAQFDSRVFQVPTRWEAYNTLKWRMQDAVRNSISGCAQVLYSHKELNNKSSKDKQELIFKKGDQLKEIFINNRFENEININKSNFNWNDIPDYLKRGTTIFKKPVTKYFSKEIYDKDRKKENWILSYIDENGNDTKEIQYSKSVMEWSREAIDYRDINVSENFWNNLIPDNK